MKKIIKNIRLVQDCKITPCSLVINNGLVEEIIVDEMNIPPDTSFDEVTEGGGCYASHGFIDIHTHGGGGGDFMDASRESYEKAARLHALHGTTAIVATTLASSTEELYNTFEVFKAVKDSGVVSGARLIGLHIEGPYINKAQCGAQDLRYIKEPDPREYKALISACPDILRWTIAPELDGALEMGEYLRKHDILPSIGHSNATYEQVCDAVSAGFSHVTHLYSAMSSIVRENGFRRLGVIESAYLIDKLTVEIIADGCHLPAPLLQMVYRFIGCERTALITDSMRGAGAEEGESILGSLKNGQRVFLENGVAMLPDRTAFAGSIATADRLVGNMVRLGTASLPEAVYMMTQTPAKVLNKVDILGVIRKGGKADIILFDENINIIDTLFDGVSIKKGL